MMAIFDWTKELKNEIKAAVSASMDTNREVARLQERVHRAEHDFERAIDHFEQILKTQATELAELRDRVATLEAQQTALHNNAIVLAAQYAANPDLQGIVKKSFHGLPGIESIDKDG